MERSGDRKPKNGRRKRPLRCPLASESQRRNGNIKSELLSRTIACGAEGLTKVKSVEHPGQLRTRVGLG